MGHINKLDTSCWEAASKLSCDHMNNLAINEMIYNRNINKINIDPPNWDKNIKDPNKELEHKIIKGYSITKKSCINKRPEYNSGSWDKQFGIYNPITNSFGNTFKEVFDENSRAKLNETEPIIDKSIISNDKNKIISIFNNNYEYMKQSSDLGSIEDRYNNHNPIIGDEFVQPSTINHQDPTRIKDPNYKPIRRNIDYYARNPPQKSDCSTLFNYDRYNINKYEKMYFEPCS